MLNKEEKLKALTGKNRFQTSVKHTMPDSRSNIDEWLEKGRPHEWLLVETNNDWSVYVDVGYGYLALFCKNRLVGTGKQHIITDENIVVLDTEYYGLKHYILEPSAIVTPQLTSC